MKDRKSFTKKSLFLFGCLACALLVAHLVHIYAVRVESWGSSGARMDFSYLKHNLTTNTLYYIKNIKFPMIFTVLASFGTLMRMIRLKERLFLVAWFLCLWGVYLFFYAGSYEYGADVRYSLMSFMPLSLLAGLGMYRFATLFKNKIAAAVCTIAAVAAVVFSFIHFVPYIRVIGEEACQARADHFYTQKMADMLPEDSIVLTHNPNMFLIRGKNAAQASTAVYNPAKMNSYFYRFKGGVFFHYNFWCNVSDPIQQKFCSDVLDKYQHVRVEGWRDKGYDFVLYKLIRADL